MIEKKKQFGKNKIESYGLSRINKIGEPLLSFENVSHFTLKYCRFVFSKIVRSSHLSVATVAILGTFKSALLCCKFKMIIKMKKIR